SAGRAATPRRGRAAGARARPGATSARRTGSAVAIAAASAGNSLPSPGGPKDSAATTPAGRMSAIIFPPHLAACPGPGRGGPPGPGQVFALLRAQCHPDGGGVGASRLPPPFPLVPPHLAPLPPFHPPPPP